MSPIRVVMRDLEVSMGTRTHLVALGTIGILAILQSNIASAARGCDGPNPDILIGVGEPNQSFGYGLVPLLFS
jgi:hypothetical protein